MEKGMEEKIITLDAYELQEYEPNRYPFLYIDRVTECVPGKYAKGYKNFTNNAKIIIAVILFLLIFPSMICIEPSNDYRFIDSTYK